MERFLKLEFTKQTRPKPLCSQQKSKAEKTEVSTSNKRLQSFGSNDCGSAAFPPPQKEKIKRHAGAESTAEWSWISYPRFRWWSWHKLGVEAPGQEILPLERFSWWRSLKASWERNCWRGKQSHVFLFPFNRDVFDETKSYIFLSSVPETHRFLKLFLRLALPKGDTPWC